MSKRWIKEHISDHYVKQAQASGYPSRAAFKLLEIQKKDHIIKPGMAVVDLGAAPGGWAMVATEIVGPKGKVFAMDLLPMKPIAGVTFIQGDFNDQAVYDKLMTLIGNQAVDLVISDMAPNITGNKSIDQPRIVQLVELAWHFAAEVLKPGGDFLAKIFQGEGVDSLVAELKQHFKVVKIRKPKASRPRSREIYILCRGYNF